MSVNTIKNPVNYEQGGARLTVFGENKTTGITSIYSIAFTPEPGGTYPQGMVRKNTREKTMKFNQNGQRGSYVFTKEPIEERKLSFNYLDDAFYWGDRVCINVDKSVLSAMFNGDSFKDGSDIIKVIGTNGTRMTSPVDTTGAQQYFTSYIGKSAMPGSDDGTGKPVLVTNDDIANYNRFGLTVMIEDFTEVSSTVGQGVRYVYCAPGMPNLTVNEDGNMKAVEFDVYCDTTYIDDYFINTVTGGYSSATTLDVSGAKTVYGINAKYIVSASTVSTFTVASGEVGDLAVVIDSDDGKVTVFECTVKDTTWAELGNKLDITYGVGCIFRGQLSGTSTSVVPTGGVGLAAVKTAGLSTAAVVATDKTSTGTGTADYIYHVKDFSFDTALWGDYTGS